MSKVTPSTDKFEVLPTYRSVDQWLSVAGARNKDDSRVTKVLTWFSSPPRRGSSQPCPERDTNMRNFVHTVLRAHKDTWKAVRARQTFFEIRVTL